MNDKVKLKGGTWAPQPCIGWVATIFESVLIGGGTGGAIGVS